MLHRISIFILIVLIVFSTNGYSQVRIGVVLPLTGRAAVAGDAVRNGAVMANQDLDWPFELIFEDNGLDNQRTISSVRRLIDVEKVDALLVYASGPSNVAAPIAEQAKIPMIGMSVDPNVSHNRSWVMIHWASNQEVSRQLLRELIQRKIKKIAIVSTQVQGNLDLEEVFLKDLKENSLSAVFKDQVLPTERDFTTLITKIRRAKPEAIFLNLYYGQAGLFASRAHALGLHVQFFGQFVLDDDSEVVASNGALNGAFFASTGAGDLSFDRRYREELDKRPVLGGIGAYDIVAIFADAFRGSAGDLERVNKNLHSLRDFTGKIGIYGALSDNSFAVPASIGEISSGNVIKRANQLATESRRSAASVR